MKKMSHQNAKTLLQEKYQRISSPIPTYNTVSKNGSSENPIWVSTVSVNNAGVLFSVKGKPTTGKRVSAEISAAQEVLNKFWNHSGKYPIDSNSSVNFNSSLKNSNDDQEDSIEHRENDKVSPLIKRWQDDNLQKVKSIFEVDTSNSEIFDKQITMAFIHTSFTDGVIGKINELKDYLGMNTADYRKLLHLGNGLQSFLISKALFCRMIGNDFMDEAFQITRDESCSFYFDKLGLSDHVMKKDSVPLTSQMKSEIWKSCLGALFISIDNEEKGLNMIRLIFRKVLVPSLGEDLFGKREVNNSLE